MKLLLQRITFTSLAFFPSVAMAHSGHEHSHNSFISGFVHPFTGLDHLMMALAFGVLIWTAHQRWKWAGLFGLSAAMIVGFMIGAQFNLATAIAENGIIASLIVLAVALWTKTNKAVPFIAALLAGFHGIAHGTELGQSGQAVLLVVGMVTAMASIYVFGLLVGAFIQKYVPYGKQMIGALTAIVAVIGLA